MAKVPTKVPSEWSTTAQMAEHLGVSTRRFRELRKEWSARGYLQEGKHWVAYSARTHRFNRPEVELIAKKMGRILRKPRQSKLFISKQQGIKLLDVSALQHSH